MQYLSHLSRRAWKRRCARNRPVGGHFPLRDAPDRGLDAHSHLRRSVLRRLIARRQFVQKSRALAVSRVLASLLHSAIHPMRISHSDPTETNSHRIIPCRSGRCPTRLMVATEIPLPIKKRVTVSPIFAIFTARE